MSFRHVSGRLYVHWITLFWHYADGVVRSCSWKGGGDGGGGSGSLCVIRGRKKLRILF